jgi:predicted transcriptional regulator
MLSLLVTINHNELISAAAERMTSKKIRKLTVTENNKVVGVVIATDLVTQLAK